MGVLGAAASAIGGKAFAESTLGKVVGTIGAMQKAGGNNGVQSGGNGLNEWISAMQNQQNQNQQQNTSQAPSILELAKTGTQFPNVRSAATYMTPDAAAGTVTQNQWMNDLWAKQLINNQFGGGQNG